MALMKEQSQRNQMNGDRTGILPVLTEQELSILRVVLQKEEQEMKLLELRISEIRREIQELRKSGALTEGDNPDGQCARCKMKLSLLALPWRDSGGRCLACKFRVCSHCCVRQKNGSRICVLCCKYRQEKQLTGDWAAKETPGCLVGSDLLRCLLRNTGRVPPSHDDINGHKYTQRPAKVKDVDTESRTSKNSQSSTEDENLKKRSYRKEGSSERNGSQSKISMGSSGKSPNVQRRESYAEAVENQRTFAKNEKGNHHRSSSPSRHSTEEKNRNGRVCTDSSSVAADVISLSSSLKDSPRAARSSDISHRSTDSSYSSRRSLNREDSIFQVSRKSTNMPSALPSRYQFRRTSSVSTDNSQRSDKSLDSAPAQSNNLSGSKSKSTTDLSQIYPKKSILRSSDTNLAFQKKEPNKSYQRKTPSFFKLPSKKDKKSKSTESLKVVKIEESKSNVKRLMNFIKGDSNSPSRRSSVGVLFDSLKAQKELSSNSNMGKGNSCLDSLKESKVNEIHHDYNSVQTEEANKESWCIRETTYIEKWKFERENESLSREIKKVKFKSSSVGKKDGEGENQARGTVESGDKAGGAVESGNEAEEALESVDEAGGAVESGNEASGKVEIGKEKDHVLTRSGSVVQEDLLRPSLVRISQNPFELSARRASISTSSINLSTDFLEPYKAPLIRGMSLSVEEIRPRALTLSLEDHGQHTRQRALKLSLEDHGQHTRHRALTLSLEDHGQHTRQRALTFSTEDLEQQFLPMSAKESAPSLQSVLVRDNSYEASLPLLDKGNKLQSLSLDDISPKVSGPFEDIGTKVPSLQEQDITPKARILSTKEIRPKLPRQWHSRDKADKGQGVSGRDDFIPSWTQMPRNICPDSDDHPVNTTDSSVKESAIERLACSALATIGLHLGAEFKGMMRSGSDLSDTLSIVTEVPEPGRDTENFHLDLDSDDTFHDTRFEDSFSDDCNDKSSQEKQICSLANEFIIFSDPLRIQGNEAVSDGGKRNDQDGDVKVGAHHMERTEINNVEYRITELHKNQDQIASSHDINYLPDQILVESFDAPTSSTIEIFEECSTTIETEAMGKILHLNKLKRKETVVSIDSIEVIADHRAEVKLKTPSNSDIEMSVYDRVAYKIIEHIMDTILPQVASKRKADNDLAYRLDESNFDGVEQGSMASLVASSGKGKQPGKPTLLHLATSRPDVSDAPADQDIAFQTGNINTRKSYNDRVNQESGRNRTLYHDRYQDNGRADLVLGCFLAFFYFCAAKKTQKSQHLC